MNIEKNKKQKYDRQAIVRLLFTYFKGKEQATRHDDLHHWLHKNTTNQALFERLNDEDYVQKGVTEFQNYSSTEGWQKVNEKIRTQKRIRRYTWTCAASVVMLLGIGVATWYVNPEPNKPYQTTSSARQNDIAPGSPKAILSLESGETIFLGVNDDSLTRKMTGEIFMNDGGKLTYLDSEKDQVHLHTLQVPRGGEYVLCLSDGTVITLNADSKIQYPDKFTGKERWVRLEGEAYFEVTKDSLRPFSVKTNGTEISVLGTSFNVKSYQNEEQQMTLVEGRVEVKHDQQKIILNPGEQATLKGEELQVGKVNVTPYIAWTKQRLVFDNETFDKILNQLQRWYDVDVIIEDDDLKGLRFTADLPKYEQITKVLEILQITTDIKFELNQRTLKVRKGGI